MVIIVEMIFKKDVEDEKRGVGWIKEVGVGLKVDMRKDVCKDNLIVDRVNVD